ncbi:hypothetical protein [Gluconobacter sp. P5H9_d]|uniref:hypothetical protein n=2 Tax=unclassified Gluconobacter TaxID=2644261 RepID=UPI001C05AB1A|nr:hypothetical protein [Gluconobacter sp. P5H9_d]
MAIFAAVRAGALKSIGTGRGGILSTEYHAKRLDPVSQKRHVRDSDPIAWSKAEGPTDYVKAFKAHKRATGASERKGADLGMEFKVVVSPEWLAETGDPHDAANPRVQQLVDEAKAWAESWGGAGAVWGLRYDTDEKGSGVVDVFMSPVREQRHKSGKSKPVISCRKAKEELLASERALEPDLKTSGAAMQSSWARWARERLDRRLERGKPKIETGAVHQNADLYARIAEQKEADLRRREEALAEREAAFAEREQKAQEVRAGSNQFAAAFRGGEVRRVCPSPKVPDRLGWWAAKDMPEARREELRAAWRLTALPVREALAEVSSAALAVEERSQALQEPEVAIEKAKAEAIAALREDFDTLKRAWVRNEATYNVSTSGDWRWWLAEGLTVARKNRLQACVQSVGEMVGFMAQQFEEMVNGVLQYISPSARSEFEAEWSEAVERGYAPEWNGVGDGPGEASGASSNGPSLGM